MKKRFLLLLLAVLLLAACSNQVMNPPEMPTPGPTPTATPDPDRIFYEVKKGDTLWSIAEKYDTTVEMLIKVNELETPDQLKLGQQILISHKVTISGEVLPTPTPTPIPCLQGCQQPVAGCVVKAYTARLDGVKLYVMPGDEIYARQQPETWFCREQDARAHGWKHWTTTGPK